MQIAGAPLDLSLRTPGPERLEALAGSIYGETYSNITSDQRAVVYGLALQELQASGLLVLAQFLASLQ